MKDTIILASTGILMGLLSALIGLPNLVEWALWIGVYVLWIVYGLKVDIASPIRRMAFASTLAGLLMGSVQVFLMEQYRTNNPWYSSAFDTSTASELSTALLGQGIGLGLGFGLVTGIIVAKLKARRG
jgi:hypothetical protein